MADDEPDWGDPGEQWLPTRTDGELDLVVDWAPPEVVGIIELPDGTEYEVTEHRVFGFARYLEEREDLMALRDTKIVQRGQEPRRCAFGRVFDRLSEDDRTFMREWVPTGVGAPSIQQALKEDGWSIGVSSVGNHLIGQCICAEDSDFVWGVRA